MCDWIFCSNSAKSSCGAKESYLSPCLPSLSCPVAFCALAHLCLPLAMNHDCFASHLKQKNQLHTSFCKELGALDPPPPPMSDPSLPGKLCYSLALSLSVRHPLPDVDRLSKFQQNSRWFLTCRARLGSCKTSLMKCR